MNKAAFTVLVVCVLLSRTFLYAQSEPSIEYSSVEAFFKMADQIKSGIDPTEEEWNQLFETSGYEKCIEETFDMRGLFISVAMDLAFSPDKTEDKDIILEMPFEEIVSDWESLLMRVMVENFLDTDKNESAIKKELKKINDKLLIKAYNRLKEFLVDPVDSLITFIPVSFVCMEPDALSLSGRIVWDCNLYCKQTEKERIDFMAHEMFHAYRKHFVNLSKAQNFIQLIDNWQNEGIADLIDKKSITDLSSAFIRFGLTESYVDGYTEIYTNTPQILKELEELTLSFLNNELPEEDFNLALDDLVRFGGHPNAYYMTTLIKNAGYEKELISTFYSPVEFMKLYNKSVSEEYMLGDRFMDYLQQTYNSGI